MSRNAPVTVYCGNLPPDFRDDEVEKLFGRFGRISRWEVKRGAQQTYAFIEYSDPRDAEYCLRDRHGYEFAGQRLSCEYSRGKGVNPNSRGPPRRNPELRMRVLNLPAKTSWQDLKDYMRTAGEVGYASMVSESVGVVEYAHKDDFEAALRKLDGSSFKSRFGDAQVIKLEPESAPAAAGGSGGGGGGDYAPRHHHDDHRGGGGGGGGDYRGGGGDYRGGGGGDYRGGGGDYRGPPPRGGGYYDDRGGGGGGGGRPRSRSRDRHHGGGGGGRYDDRDRDGGGYRGGGGGGGGGGGHRGPPAEDRDEFRGGAPGPSGPPLHEAPGPSEGGGGGGGEGGYHGGGSHDQPPPGSHHQGY